MSVQQICELERSQSIFDPFNECALVVGSIHQQINRGGSFLESQTMIKVQMKINEVLVEKTSIHENLIASRTVVLTLETSKDRVSSSASGRTSIQPWVNLTIEKHTRTSDTHSRKINFYTP